MNDPEMNNTAKQATASLFDQVSASYDQVGVDFFSVFGAELVAAAGLQSGQSVLDVGFGRGAVLFPAAAAVGPTGRVLGVDLAPGMVELTQAAVARENLSQVTVRLGDAEAPLTDADPRFDAVVSGLVIFFLPDPDAALASYHHALVPGGTLALSTFGDEDDRFKPVFAAAAAHVEVPDGAAPATTPARLPDSPFASAEGVAGILTRHGFESIRQVEHTHDVEFRDAAHWIEWSKSHGARALWDRIPEQHRSAARGDVIDALNELARPDGSITHRWRLRYSTAKRPG